MNANSTAFGFGAVKSANCGAAVLVLLAAVWSAPATAQVSADAAGSEPTISAPSSGGAMLPFEIDAKAMQLVPLVVSFDRLEKMGELTFGWGCWTHFEQVWTKTEKSNELTKMMDQRLRVRMGDAGFSLPQDPLDIFGETSDTSRFKLGGTIDRIQMDICAPSGGMKTKGSASLKITWKIYSKTEQKIVAVLEVETSHVEPKTIRGDMYAILFAAFDKAVDKLFASQEFQAAATP